MHTGLSGVPQLEQLADTTKIIWKAWKNKMLSYPHKAQSNPLTLWPLTLMDEEEQHHSS